MSAKVIRRRVTGWKIDQAQLLIGAHGGPAVWRSRGIGFARRRGARTIRSSHVPCPGQLTGDRIESADNARRLPPELAVGDPATEHDFAAYHRGGRGHVVIGFRGLGHACQEIDSPGLAEASAALAGMCVECVERCGAGRREYPLGACAGCLRHAVIGDAAAGAPQLSRRLAVPALFTGLGIEGEDFIDAVAGVQRVPDHQRRDFQAGFVAVGGMGKRHVPDFLELADVLAGDLNQRTEP